MRNVSTIDIPELEALEEALEICKKKRKMTLILSHVNEQPFYVMTKTGFIEKIGQDNVCKNIDASLERAENFA